MLYETFSNSLLVEGSEAHSLSEEGKHAINRTAINCVAILYSTAVFFLFRSRGRFSSHGHVHCHWWF